MRYHLYEVPRVVKLTERRGMLAGAWGRGNGELVFHGYRVSVWEDKKVLEIDCGGGRITLSMYWMPLSCALENG